MPRPEGLQGQNRTPKFSALDCLEWTRIRQKGTAVFQPRIAIFLRSVPNGPPAGPPLEQADTHQHPQPRKPWDGPISPHTRMITSLNSQVLAPTTCRPSDPVWVTTPAVLRPGIQPCQRQPRGHSLLSLAMKGMNSGSPQTWKMGEKYNPRRDDRRHPLHRRNDT